MIQLDLWSRTKNPTHIVVRNPTPPKNLRLLTTLTPQPCFPKCIPLNPAALEARHQYKQGRDMDSNSALSSRTGYSEDA